MTFEQELASLINRASRENESNTPDFILAEFIRDCLVAYERTTRARDQWYGIAPEPGRAAPEDEEALARAAFKAWADQFDPMNPDMFWDNLYPNTRQQYAFMVNHAVERVAALEAAARQAFVEGANWQRNRERARSTSDDRLRAVVERFFGLYQAASDFWDDYSSDARIAVISEMLDEVDRDPEIGPILAALRSPERGGE